MSSKVVTGLEPETYRLQIKLSSHPTTPFQQQDIAGTHVNAPQSSFCEVIIS